MTLPLEVEPVTGSVSSGRASFVETYRVLSVAVTPTASWPAITLVAVFVNGPFSDAMSSTNDFLVMLNKPAKRSSLDDPLIHLPRKSWTVASRFGRPARSFRQAASDALK